VFGGEGGIVAENSYHVVQLLHRASAAQNAKKHFNRV